MSNLGNKIGAASFGIVSAMNGYCALDNLLDFANTKAVALQTQLFNAPELTEQLYQSAREATDKVASGDYYLGLVSAAAAGLSLGFCLYHACRKDKE